MVSQDFIGRGWAFPVHTDSSGNIALVGGATDIEQAIRLILGTAYGERPMRPEFGCAIHDFVFASVTGSTAGRIAFEVRRSLDRWEPRINVLDVNITFDTQDSSTIYIDITYEIRGTNNPRNLVFPFYIIPAEANA